MITELMKEELERVVMKGNADKLTIQKISAILWELEERIVKLESHHHDPVTEEVAPAEETPEVTAPAKKTAGGTRGRPRKTKAAS